MGSRRALMDWDVRDCLAAPMILLSLEEVVEAMATRLEMKTRVDKER